MKIRNVTLLLILISLSNLHAQSVFKVENRLQQIYSYVPNPISFASFGVDADSTRIKVVGGIIDTIKGTIYWTPQPITSNSNSYLLFQGMRNQNWNTLDTVFSGYRIVAPKNFTATPSNIDFHGEPNILNFQKLKPVVVFEYSHLPLDTMVRVVKYDALLFNDKRIIVESLTDISNENNELLKKRVLNEQIKYIQFVNIYLESKFWAYDNEYIMSKAKDSRVYNFRSTK